MNVDDNALREVFTVIALWRLMDKIRVDDAGDAIARIAVNVARICVEELNKLKEAKS